MDFADDFTCFNFQQVLEEAKRLYGHNRHLQEIRLQQAANDEPVLEFYMAHPCRLNLRQLGLPLRFRCLEIRVITVHSAR